MNLSFYSIALYWLLHYANVSSMETIFAIKTGRICNDHKAIKKVTIYNATEKEVEVLVDFIYLVNTLHFAPFGQSAASVTVDSKILQSEPRKLLPGKQITVHPRVITKNREVLWGIEHVSGVKAVNNLPVTKQHQIYRLTTNSQGNLSLEGIQAE